MTENNSSIKKNEIMLFVTKWMDLEGIMLNEITQVKKNTVWFHLDMEFEKQNKWTDTAKQANS